MKKFICSHSSVCRIQNCRLNYDIARNPRAVVFRTLVTNVHGYAKFGSDSSPIFKPRKAAVLSRITRYEFEKLRHKGISEEEFKEKVDHVCGNRSFFPLTISP